MKLSNKTWSAMAFALGAASWTPLVRGAKLRRTDWIRNSNTTMHQQGILYDETNRDLQGKESERCTLLVSVKEFEGSQPEGWEASCAMANGKMYNLNWGKEFIQGLVKGKKLESGASQLNLQGLMISHGQGTIRAAENTKNIIKPPKPNKRRKLLTAGVKTLLIVRVIGADAATTASMAQLSDDVFGTSGDTVNLKSQYAACSYNQLTFNPAVGSGVTNGVREVTINQIINGVSEAVVREAVTTAIGGKPAYANYVMYCLPPGTSGGWIAYAYINSWLSVYNDQWCRYVSGQMHEVGHNLGLGHSNENGLSYQDQSGMMGYSYGDDDGPLMCFNAVKSWQLGWYSSKAILLEASSADRFSGALSGIVDYNLASSGPVLIRLNTAGTNDYYINYNKQAGFNAGTVEGGNQVLVVQAPGDGTGYTESNLVSKLSAGGSYTFSGVTSSGQDMILEVKSININGSADIVIRESLCATDADCYPSWTCDVPTGECISKCSGSLAVSITPDSYPGETTWDLKQDTLIFASGDVAGMSPATIPVSCGTLTFTIYDSYGDGMCCGYGSGAYSVSWDGTVVGTGGQFTYSSSTTFEVTAPNQNPTTPAPTRARTPAPTKKPTAIPTKRPTRAPTKRPTRAPTKRPTRKPTKRPTRAPTKRPTRKLAITND